MNYEKLITCVQSKIPLWDQRSKEYHNRAIGKKLWEEVGQEMNETSIVVKNKWRNLRDHFRKELAKTNASRSGDAAEERRSKWAYFDIMSFLKDTLINRPSTGNLPAPDTAVEMEVEGSTSDVQDISIENFDSTENTPEENAFSPESRKECYKKKFLGTKKNKTMYEKLFDLEKQKLDAFKSNKKNDSDSDYMFLMSLLPQLKKLSPVRNMYMRVKIQELFLAEEEFNFDRQQIVVNYPLNSPNCSSNDASLYNVHQPVTTQQSLESPQSTGNTQSEENNQSFF